jgi:hypothetical protein
VLGIDVARRVGNAMFDHYDRAGIITGSTGTLALPPRAPACSNSTPAGPPWRWHCRLQPIGMREKFGTMTKLFHPRAAARKSRFDVRLLAAQGYTKAPAALEGRAA